MMRMEPKTGKSGGVSLVELVIFGLVLGIAAALVVPQWSGASEDGRTATLRGQLATIRAQIRRFEDEHGGRVPSARLFVQQMTGQTDAAGEPAGEEFAGQRLGPYLQQVPRNPFTGGGVVGSGAAGTSDWFYDETSGEFSANDAPARRGY